MVLSTAAENWCTRFKDPSSVLFLGFFVVGAMLRSVAQTKESGPTVTARRKRETDNSHRYFAAF